MAARLSERVSTTTVSTGVQWVTAPTLPEALEFGYGYLTQGGQTVLLPADPVEGKAITFADLNDDWSETNYLTLDGNGSLFNQDSETTYRLDLKGANAQFAYLSGEWRVVNFGRLSDAYGANLDEELADYATLALVNSKPNDNLLINGGFEDELWQRGNGFTKTGTSGATYTTDRWSINYSTVSNSVSMSRQKFSENFPITEFASKNYAFFQANTISSGSVTFGQKIENILNFLGKTVTLSFWAGTGAIGDTFNVDSLLNYGVGGTSSAAGLNTTFTTTVTDLEKFSVTIDVPKTGSEVIGADNNFEIFFSLTEVKNLAITQVKLEYGNTATPFQARPIGEELTLCERYYQAFPVGALENLSGTIRFGGTLRAAMRTIPAYTFLSYSGATFTSQNAVSWTAVLPTGGVCITESADAEIY